MLSERLKENDRPFNFLDYPGYEKITKIRGGQLMLLGLTFESTADETRNAALAKREQMREKGLNIETVKALRWALEQTHDCLSENQFLWFLLEDFSFESIESSRRW
jgi:hypothetical protein